MKPLRISVIGIDGSGKSTTTLKAIKLLSRDTSVCKTGRTPFFIREETYTPCFPRIANAFETLFKKIDATRKRAWIGLTRLLFVFLQGWLEPYMIKKHHPDLIMTTRCMIIDSAIYSDFYYPWISRRMKVEVRLKFAQWFSRLPYRDIYFFLDTPIETALERIHKRISDEHQDMTDGRSYWLHLHEHEAALRVLDQSFRAALEVVKRKTSCRVIEIETAARNEEEVSRLILGYTRDFVKTHDSNNGGGGHKGIDKKIC